MIFGCTYNVLYSHMNKELHLNFLKATAYHAAFYFLFWSNYTQNVQRSYEKVLVNFTPSPGSSDSYMLPNIAQYHSMTQQTNLYPKSGRKCSYPKAVTVLEIPVKTMTKELATNGCLTLKSVVLNLHLWQKGRYTGKERRKKFPRILINICDKKTVPTAKNLEAIWMVRSEWLSPFGGCCMGTWSFT